MSNVLDELLQEAEAKLEVEREERRKERKIFESSLMNLAKNLAEHYQVSIKESLEIFIVEQKLSTKLLLKLTQEQEKMIVFLKELSQVDVRDESIIDLLENLKVYLENSNKLLTDY